MASLQASSFINSSSYPTLPRISKKKGTILAILDIPRSISSSIPLHKLQAEQLVAKDFTSFGTALVDKYYDNSINNVRDSSKSHPLVIEKLYAILETVADRVEMHKNIGEQRENWNSLLLTSINTITLAATTMSGIASTVAGAPLAALKLLSTLMLLAATSMLAIVNKIQPSQLAEEQRNAARLFKQLHNQIQTIVTIGNPAESDVKDAMEKVLAHHKAYPLPLLGVMLEKFPSQVEPAVWWPQQKPRQACNEIDQSGNGWNSTLEKEMKAIIEVIRRKDKAEYLRLGGKALKLSKMLAVTGPLLTGIAAIGSAFVGCPSQFGSCAAMLGIVCGALASVVNAMEHGGQVGMVFEMYRSNAGFFKLMEESIESNLMERRENGELFELKTALQLGRSLSELRDLASSSSSSSLREKKSAEEFASKLF